MSTYKRLSPVKLVSLPVEKEHRNGWEVVLRYENEGDGPFLIDLSHITRWDVQDKDLSKIQPGDVAVPEVPGHSIFQNGLIVNRMNRTQASVWEISGSSSVVADRPAYTETTDVHAFLAIVGPQVFSIMEKVSSLDLAPRGRTTPFLVQGPVLHVPCQIVVVQQDARSPGILMTFSRGYGQSMVDALLDAGAHFGLRPAGEKALTVSLAP